MNAVRITSAVIERAGMCLLLLLTVSKEKRIIFCQHLSLFAIREFADKTFFLCYILHKQVVKEVAFGYWMICWP